MGENTKIEYADDTFSPWHGCCHVSAGCVHCFAETSHIRWGQPELWRRHGPRRVVSDRQWAQPAKWNAAAQRAGKVRLVLCGTECDVFEDHPAVGESRLRLFQLIEQTRWLAWMLFTKRPENMNPMTAEVWGTSWPDNAWAITSVEDQPNADVRVTQLLNVTGAPVKGLSVEPLIGPVDLSMCDWTPPGAEGFPGVHNPLTGEWWPAVGNAAEEYACRVTDHPRLDWVIVGGESGGGARPMDLAWARAVVRQCRDAGVPVYVKQLGAVGGRQYHAGLKGGDWGNWPEDLMVRELPQAARLIPGQVAR